MTLIARWAVELVGRKSAARFDQATRSVAQSQEHKLQEILQRNADTEYGREHGFAKIRTLAEYTKSVPLVTYDDIAERVKRMTRAEENVLTAEKPVMFARTSGTTGEPKFIPVTPTCQGRDHADQMRTWLYHAQVDHPGIFRGKVLSFVSPAVEGHTEAGIPYGSTTGVIYRNLPGVIQKTYLAPYPVFEIEDYETKYYVLIRLGLMGDVTFLCTANPSSIVKLCEFAEQHADDLIRDVRDGTAGHDLELSEEVRAAIAPLCRPDPERARELEAMRERRGGKLLPADFWPSLELIGCWKGGTVGSHVERFAEWFDPDGKRPVAVRDWGYLSSEARGSIPLSDEGSGGVLTVSTNVYEFVEAEQVDDHPDEREQWNFLGAHELDSPNDYYVFITTTGGLYRYDINDVVRVEGFHNEAPIITFQRKGRGMTSITGEKVSVNQVIEAVTKAAEETGVAVPHFCALADSAESRYVFQVEPEGELSEQQGRELLAAIENKLASQNLEYEGKRKSQRLAAPELEVMQHGWYDRRKEAQGKRLFQAKTVVLEAREENGDRDEEEEPVARIPLEGEARKQE